MSRKCRAIRAYKRDNPLMVEFLTGGRWPLRKSIAKPYNPMIPTSKRFTPCEWRRFYKRNPYTLHAAKSLAVCGKEPTCTVYARHLKRLNIKLEPVESE